MNNKIFNIFRWTVVISLFGIIFLLGYWYFCPYTPVEFNYPDGKEVVEIMNENHEVKSGGYLEVKLNYCKYTKEVPIITTTFVDGIIYNTPPDIAVNKDIGCSERIAYIYVPKALPPGEMNVVRTYRYKPNPIKTIDVTIKTEKFTILSNK